MEHMQLFSNLQELPINDLGAAAITYVIEQIEHYAAQVTGGAAACLAHIALSTFKV